MSNLIKTENGKSSFKVRTVFYIEELQESLEKGNMLDFYETELK